MGQFPGCSLVPGGKERGLAGFGSGTSAAQLWRRTAGDSQTPLCAVSVKLPRASVPPTPPAAHGPCRAVSGKAALYLRRPLSMKHRSPQLLSPSSFSTSAFTGASMAPATRIWVLTRAQRWVGKAGIRLPGARKSGPRGRPRTLPPTDSRHFPALTVSQSQKPELPQRGLPSLLRYLRRDSRALP